MRFFLILSAVTALVSAQAETVYRLTWVGDYQTGAWDTDAAENIAFNPATARAFIASAESGVVQVVSVTNPTDMTGARATPTDTDSHSRAQAHALSTLPYLEPCA
jgi:hypothetical protein